MTDRPPPTNIELELRLLSCWFGNEAFQQAWRPEPSIFFDGLHRSLAVVGEDANGSPLTVTDAATILNERDQLKRFGGTVRLMGLLDGVPALADPWKAVERLRELAGLRDLRRTGLQVLASIGDEDCTLAKVSGELAHAITTSTMRLGAQVETGRAMIDDVLNQMHAEEPVEFCTTGLEQLDTRIGGMRSRSVLLFGADTNWGKSGILCMMVDENVKRGKTCLIVSGEDERELYSYRLACRRARVKATRLRDRRLRPQDQEALAAAMNQYEWQRLFFINGIGVPAEHLAAQVRAVCLAKTIDLVLIDYIQAFETESDDRRNEVRKCGRAFTNAIKSTNASGVIFSQLTLEKGQKRPTKADVRDSKDIAQAAETIALGWEDVNGNRKILLDKVKQGRKGMEIDVHFDSETASFVSDVDPDQMELAYEDAVEERGEPAAPSYGNG